MDANNHEAFNCQIKHLLTEKRVVDVSRRKYVESPLATIKVKR